MNTKLASTHPKDSLGGFDARRHLKILKALVIAANLFVLFMYASLFFVFADMPFVLVDELKMIANFMAWATGFGIGFGFLIFAGDGLSWLIRNRKRVKFPAGTTASPDYSSTTALIIDMHPPIDKFEASNN
jgi:hypothetical protein